MNNSSALYDGCCTRSPSACLVKIPCQSFISHFARRFPVTRQKEKAFLPKANRYESRAGGRMEMSFSCLPLMLFLTRSNRVENFIDYYSLRDFPMNSLQLNLSNSPFIEHPPKLLLIADGLINYHLQSDYPARHVPSLPSSFSLDPI